MLHEPTTLTFPSGNLNVVIPMYPHNGNWSYACNAQKKSTPYSSMCLCLSLCVNRTLCRDREVCIRMKPGLSIQERNDLETDLNRRRDLGGSLVKISTIKSSHR